MNDKQIIKEILDKEGWTQIMLAEALGITRQGINMALREDHKDPKYKNKGIQTLSLLEMLDILGYEMVIRSKKPNDKTTYKLDKNSFGKKGE